MPKILVEMSRAELEAEATRRRVREPRNLDLGDLRRVVRMKRILEGPKRRR